jgi:hypothetical protein
VTIELAQSNPDPDQTAEGTDIVAYDVESGRTWPERLRESGLPEIATERQPSLVELLARAKAENAPALLQVWTYVVATPVTALAYWVQWSLRSPGRGLAAAVFTVLIGTAVDHIPLIRILVPGFLDFTDWL